mgnify:CR=1 FL=1
MTTGGQFKINLTTDSGKIAMCAKMMTNSDPWITLGFSYDECLPAFDGLGKEICVMEIYGKIVGYELIEEKTLKNALARRKYILKFEFYFLTFDFILYNNNTGWTVSNFYYKDETKELF